MVAKVVSNDLISITKHLIRIINSHNHNCGIIVSGKLFDHLTCYVIFCNFMTYTKNGISVIVFLIKKR